MAGKQISLDQLKAAIAAYCAANGKQQSLSEDGKIRIFAGTPDPATDRVLWLEDGGIRGNDLDFTLSFVEEWLVEPKAASSPTKPMNVPAKARNGSNGAMKPVSSAIRDIQVAEMTFDDIRNFLCPAASDRDTFMFLKLCQARNLNPFCNEAYLIPYEDKKSGEIKCSMVVGKEAFMRKAEANPHYRGFKAGLILSKGDELIYREGDFQRKGETLEGGWCEVYRDDRNCPVRAEKSLAEYDKGHGLWNQGKKATMIRKVAVVSGHREAFPSDTSGMYGSEEMGIDPEKEIQA